MSAKTKVWSNPAEALKAIVSGLITFAGAVVLSLSTNGNSAPSLVQWLIAGIFGLGALVTTYWIPNADAKQKAAVQAVEKVAVDVVQHNPQQAVTDATAAVVDQYWKQTFVNGQRPPPTPVVASEEPLSTVASTVPVSVAPKPAYSGPIPPVSEPVGATAVSATP